MFVIGFIFAVVAPVTNVIVFVTYAMMVAINRFFVLYIDMPDVTSDLSSQMNLLVNVINSIFIGLSFMLVSTLCYFLIQEG